MKENKVCSMLLEFMKYLNLIILVYIVLVTSYSIRGCVSQNNALAFLNSTGDLPMEYWKMTVLAIGLFVCLFILLSLNSRNNFELFGKIFFEILVGIFICSVIHFGYSGVILLILADGMKYAQNMKLRVIIIAFVCAVYLFMDYNFMSIYFHIVSLETMWMYFEKNSLAMLLTVLNILSAVNMFIFINYMIVLILDKINEKERIMSLNAELEEKNNQLLIYAKEMEKVAQTKERNRLAREIHDTLGHALTGIITGIDACVMLMDAAPDAAKEQLKVIGDVARQGIKDVRRSINALRPDALEKIILEQALRQMIDEMSRSTGVDIVFQCDTSINAFNQDEEDIIYRIVQESITNSIRHGKASHIDVCITREFNILKINLSDNGVGCKNVKKGFGLHHMEERLQLLNGNLEYDGSDGFKIYAQIPIRWGEENADDKDTNS